MSNKFKRFIILILIFGSTLLLAPHALAAVDTGLNTINNSIVLSSVSPFKVVTNVINVLMGLLSLVALVLILAGGFIWMTSNGSEEKITTAKKILRNAAIGLVIILSAWGITYFILNKLIDVTGGSSNNNNCTNGATQSCGCGYSGEQTCNGTNWGPCLGESCGQIVPGQTSCDGNIGLAECQADNQLCGSENLCDTTDCICKPKSSLGDSCNANPSGSCSADDNLCGPYLKCDPNSCVCTGPPVITGISPAGGFCTNDQNRACNLDADCLGGATCDTLTPNGNVGNFLTIYGYNFGSNVDSNNSGNVYFLGSSASQTKAADLPTTLNPNCINSWADRQVIIAVPADVAAGPIEIKRDNLEVNVDSTNDDQGPKIPDFIKNNINRPGLCQITPTQGLLGDVVVYSGVNLINSEAYFGSYTSSYKGIGSDFSTDNLSGKTLAPSITPGKTTTFVEQTTTGINQKSNALIFVKEKEAAAGPYISSFYPATGAAGQYVTILGSGFGNLRGSRQVLFGDKEASYAFPDVCTNAVWSDSQVIVKVPDGLSSNDYKIQMNLGTKIINTDLLSPNTFKVDPTKTLKTSLCKIDPVRGQIGDKVSLWGEHFGNQGTDALVVFNRDISTSSKIIKDGNADKIETVVPISSTNVPAITGPVHVAKNGEWGNELNFTVGKCASNDECGASSPICCAGNTYKAGSCESSLLSCYFEVPNSVYETKFSTTLSSAGDNTKFDSCIGMAAFYGTCQTGQFCPNSPGKCSPFTPVAPEVLGDCGTTSECGALDYCKTNPDVCVYNKTKDNCQAKQCILEKELPYSLTAQVDGKDTVINYKGSLSCRAYNDKTTNQTYFVKELKVNTSCPDGYINVGGGYCVNSTPVPCDPCATGFKCIDNGAGNDLGTCESAKICASGSACGINPNDATKYSCLKAGEAKCDCCCEIGQDTRDCCAGLTCAGTCGSDTVDDGVGYGSCSGCAVGNNVAQNDAACNCSTASGKICDTSKPGGVCTDCAALDEAGCSAHSSQCCFDATKNVCQGGNGTILPSGKCAYYDCGVFDTNGVFDKTQCNQNATTTGQFLATSTCITNCAKDPKTACDLLGGDATACSNQVNCCFDAKNNKCTNGTDKINLAGVNYCGYYNCDTDTETCSGIASTTGQVLGQAACEKNCKSVVTLPGLTCAAAAIGVCNTSFCGDPYQCLSVSGSSPTASECGTCCCTPGTKNGDLTCLADQGSCDGSSRGLFCGCTSDDQCGPDSQGCGGDTCCHGRPQITTTDPQNNDQNVCRNRQIEVDFNQAMNITTLAANISLVEEKTYGVDTCPNGTTLAFNSFKPKNTNFLARLFDTITNSLKHLFGGSVNNSAIAAAPSPDKLYCVYPITVESKMDYTNNATSTKVYIQPQKILAANTNYFVIIKGDTQLDSNSGVMSLDKVGLNASLNSPISSNLDSSSDYSKPNVAVFNDVAFNHSYTFGFTTMSDNSGKNGLCVINNVVVNPTSFLIKTADNDVSDDNPGDAATFDTINDNDRAVSAFAYSADGQLLQPVSGYNWNWKWNIEDPTVAHSISVTGLKDNQMLVGSIVGVTDKSTKISASVDMSNFNSTNATFSGNGLRGTSDLYVFLCANPWPMESSNGIWNPWSDKEQCKDTNGQIVSCLNYNYKFYYCRDAGVAGTADDLPAVADPALILGTSGNLICSTDGSACSSQNASCGSGGICVWSVLKESYFFREAIPQNGEITEAKSTGAGGQVVLSWDSPINPLAPVSLFKIYYGLANSQSSASIIPLSLTEANCNPLNNANHCSYLINNLIDGSKYYFKVSSLTDKKAESPLSGGQEATSTDTTAPVAPNWYNVPRVMFWSGKVNQHFDLVKGIWATDSDGSSGAEVDKLQYCKKFYPTTVSVVEYKLETITTWKSSGNIGDSTNTKMSYRCILNPEMTPITILNDKLNINWLANTDDTLYYRLFHGILANKKASDSVDSPNNVNSLSLDLSNYRAGDNFFYLAAIDKSGNVSDTSDEIKITIPAAPTNLKVSQNSSGLSISWDSNSAGVLSYSLFADTDSNVKTLIAPTGKDPFYSWPRTSVVNGVSKTNYSDGDYYFAVSVKNDQGFESTKSDVIRFTVTSTGSYY